MTLKDVIEEMDWWIQHQTLDDIPKFNRWLSALREEQQSRKVCIECYAFDVELHQEPCLSCCNHSNHKEKEVRDAGTGD